MILKALRDLQTLLDQSPVAVCEKIENDLDSMEAEAENLKDHIARLQEQQSLKRHRQETKGVGQAGGFRL